MYILLWLLFGAAVGWAESVFMKTNRRMGLIANIVVGLIGSALGMWLMGVLRFGNFDAFSFAGVVVSIGGASLLIAIISALTRR
jgi:uncharacterized membrane protein YeaQ/YmgE (transglycosylase-associated protein family)